MNLYQIESESNIELVLVRTTLEAATNVTYTCDQFVQEYDRSIWRNLAGWWWSDKTCFVNIPELIRQVNQQLVNGKEASFNFDNRTLECLGEHNPTFKEHGVMFRPSKGVFVKWKAKTKKVVVSKQLLNGMRNDCNDSIRRFVQDKFGFHFKLDCCANLKDQARLVRFGVANGLTWDMLSTGPYFGYTWRVVDDSTKWAGTSLVEHVTTQLSDRNEEHMIEETIAVFKKWFDDSLNSDEK